jgi:ABC-type multidrug transport system fused ATPase/permease subunit
MQESLSATTLIKSFGSEKREVKRVVGELQAAQQVALEQTAVNSVANLIVNALPDVTRMVVVIAGAYLIVKGSWSLGSLLAFQSYLGYVHTPARYLASIGLQIQQAHPALERVSALYDIVPEEGGDAGIAVARLDGTVEFRGVTFAYDAAQPVLQDISFSVPAGGHVAIVGPSGVGKTTLVSLLLRFYRPTAGEIRFDGRPATDYELHALRQRIGYVSQSTLLLSGTIGGNLRYGNPDADDAQVIQAAKVAGIHDYIAGLPDGYQAVVGERGVNLSEGQKQRLAIARALIRNPDILVMDEPTSALDSVTEKSIFDALPRLVRDKTLFIIAHRLKTVQNADQILVLNEQRLVAVGTHRELLESNAYYRSLVTNQQTIAPEGAAAI